MTDRIKGFTVALDNDYRTDDVERIMDAILMIKGVIGVTSAVVTGDDYMNRMRIREEFKNKLFDIFIQ